MSWVNVNAPNRFEWFLIDLRSIIIYALEGDCSHECAYDGDYEQFIPECGCPIHDSGKWWHKPLINLLSKFTGDYSDMTREYYELSVL